MLQGWRGELSIPTERGHTSYSNVREQHLLVDLETVAN